MPRHPDPEVRDRILQTAGRLFYAHGIQAVGMAQIVAEAGCGKNVLYRHFPSKADLVATYLVEFARMREDEFDRVLVDFEDDPAEALVAVTRHIAGLAAHPRFQGCPIRNSLRELRTQDDLPGRTAVTLLADWRARVDAVVARVHPDDPVGAAVLAERVWLVHEGLYAGTHRDRVAAGQTAVALVADLVRRPREVVSA
ncbi:TetR/AcrR family transcriptional regulator [Nocardioides rubriscoriae]|uniref:TetR/AcrR family transcriptional regulator n=1 Tax=Nocardioides rubriscoriae TaxID=642762 RepID=UPI0011E04526|nr:TetR/AcrR family transcriptional regulator [Nocardioides rubriscoriae]